MKPELEGQPARTKLPVVVTYATRNEAVRLAPVVRALRASARLRPVVVTPRSRRAAIAPVNAALRVRRHAELDFTDVPLDKYHHGKSLSEVTSAALASFSEYFDRRPVSAVVVQGSSTASLAAALAASSADAAVVHLDAEATPGHRRAFEIHGHLARGLASLHLVPTMEARDHLLAAGVAGEDVVVTGSTAADAVLYAARSEVATGDARVDDAVAHGRPIVLVAARRRTWSDGLAAIGTAAARIARSRPELLVALTVTADPSTRRWLLPPVRGVENVCVLDPLRYDAFAHLMAGARLVLTDSPSIQEQAPGLGVPVLAMHTPAGRRRTVTTNAVRLAGNRTSGIVGETLSLLEHDAAYARPASGDGRFGDGEAAHRCGAAIELLLGVGDRTAELRTGKAGAAVAVAS